MSHGSTEVAVKRRGRPKKIMPDVAEVEVPEFGGKTTRAKSTKAAPKATKSAAVAPQKTTVVKKTVSKSATPPVPTKSAPGLRKVEAHKSKSPVASQARTPVTPATSKILEEVRKIPVKDVPAGDGTKSVKPPVATVKPESVPGPAQPKSAPSSAAATSSPAKNTTKQSTPELVTTKDSISIEAKPRPPPPAANTSPPPPMPKPTPKIPIAALNSSIVSNISTRAGARPNTSGSHQLPKNYKSVSRRITMAIVAAPIAIVTSYVLYQRLVLGEERKMLVSESAVGEHRTAESKEGNLQAVAPSGMSIGQLSEESK